MLKGISPLISPDLLSTLYRMGHGDEIVLADAHFPGEALHSRIVRADGHKINGLLWAILPLFDLDPYVDSPLIMMAPVAGDTADPQVEADYREPVDRFCPGTAPIQFIERFEFYERAKKSFAIVMTGETRIYGNLILKKGNRME